MIGLHPLVAMWHPGYYWRISFNALPASYASATKDALISDVVANGDNFNISFNVVSASPILAVCSCCHGRTAIATCDELYVS